MLACHQSKVIIRGFYSGELEKTWKKFIRKQLRNPRRISDDIIFITFAGCNARQQEYIRSEVQKLIPFKRVIMQRASVSVACNAGMYSIGMAYYRLD
jgi:hypothetical protein